MVEPATRPTATTRPRRTAPDRIRTSPETLTTAVGMWSSAAAAVVLVLAMVLFALVGPWKNMAAYAADADGWIINGIWAMFLLLTIFFVPAVAAVHAATPERWRLLSLTGLGFAVAYAAICSANCVIQLAFVRQRIAVQHPAGEGQPRRPIAVARQPPCFGHVELQQAVHQGSCGVRRRARRRRPAAPSGRGGSRTVRRLARDRRFRRRSGRGPRRTARPVRCGTGRPARPPRRWPARRGSTGSGATPPS
jgi:hypothetical protein